MPSTLTAQEIAERLIIKALSGQTGNVQEWQDAVGDILASMSPAGRLDLRERIRVRGGAPAEGKVLMSDADGLARWDTVRYATLAKMGL